MFYSLYELLNSSNSDLESFAYMEIGIIRKIQLDREPKSPCNDSDSLKVTQMKKYVKGKVSMPERKAS